MLSEPGVTLVPPEFFDELVTALDAPYVPNEPLQRAARRACEVFTD